MLQQSQNGALVLLEPLDFHSDFRQPALEDYGGLRSFRFAEKSPNVRQLQAGSR
jgi:hypothetical protein